MVMQNAFALVFNVVGNLLLVPQLGVIASAWLTVATEAIVCIGAILLLRGQYGFRDMAGVSKRPAVALVAFVAVGIASTRSQPSAYPSAPRCSSASSSRSRHGP